MRLYHCYYCILLLPSATIAGVTANSLERFDSRVTPPANARDVAGQRGGIPVTRMLRVQETIDTEQRMLGTGFFSKAAAKFGLVPPETKKLLAIVKSHTLSQQQSASNADGAIKFLTTLTDKNLGLFKSHLVNMARQARKARKARQAQRSKELDADTLVADYLVASFGDEILAKAFVKLGGAKELLTAQKVQSIVFRKWAADGKKPDDIISLLKITDDVEVFEPGVTNFLLKFGKETKDREFSMDDVNAAMLKHWDGNYARHISGIWQWEAKAMAKLGDEAKFIAGSRYEWVLRHIAKNPLPPGLVPDLLKFVQWRHSALKDGAYLHLTDDQLKKVVEDYTPVLKLVSGDPN